MTFHQSRRGGCTGGHSQRADRGRRRGSRNSRRLLPQRCSRANPTRPKSTVAPGGSSTNTGAVAADLLQVQPSATIDAIHDCKLGKPAASPRMMPVVTEFDRRRGEIASFPRNARLGGRPSGGHRIDSVVIASEATQSRSIICWANRAYALDGVCGVTTVRMQTVGLRVSSFTGKEAGHGSCRNSTERR